jgi:N-methylhydantoinase A
VAVSLLHAYAHPENERRAVAVLREELDEPVDLINCRVTATVPGDPPTIEHDPQGDPLLGKRDLFFPSGFYRAPVYDRARVPVDANVDGPAILAGGESTVVLPPDWSAHAAEDGTLVLEAGEE